MSYFRRSWNKLAICLWQIMNGRSVGSLPHATIVDDARRVQHIVERERLTYVKLILMLRFAMIYNGQCIYFLNRLSKRNILTKFPHFVVGSMQTVNSDKTYYKTALLIHFCWFKQTGIITSVSQNLFQTALQIIIYLLWFKETQKKTCAKLNYQ